MWGPCGTRNRPRVAWFGRVLNEGARSRSRGSKARGQGRAEEMRGSVLSSGGAMVEFTVESPTERLFQRDPARPHRRAAPRNGTGRGGATPLVRIALRHLPDVHSRAGRRPVGHHWHRRPDRDVLSYLGSRTTTGISRLPALCSYPTNTGVSTFHVSQIAARSSPSATCATDRCHSGAPSNYHPSGVVQKRMSCSASITPTPPRRSHAHRGRGRGNLDRVGPRG